MNTLIFMTKIEEVNNPKEEKCCEIKDNYQDDQGIIKCKICSNTISNISDGPEWRYYGSSDNKSNDPTRCGMPVNTLLPESSVGSTISFGKNTKTMNQIKKSVINGEECLIKKKGIFIKFSLKFKGVVKKMGYHQLLLMKQNQFIRLFLVLKFLEVQIEKV